MRRVSWARRERQLLISEPRSLPAHQRRSNRWAECGNALSTNDSAGAAERHYIALANPRPNMNEDPLFREVWRAVPIQNATAEQTILMWARR